MARGRRAGDPDLLSESGSRPPRRRKASPDPSARPPRPKPSRGRSAAPNVPAAAPNVAAAPRVTAAPRVVAPSDPSPGAPEPRRRVVVTGGSGFVGRAVVRRLVARGDDVTVTVRDRRRLMDVADLEGATIVEDDLADVRRLVDDLHDVDAVIHAAGSYRVGIARSERGAMWDANIGTTTRVLDAAEQAGVGRIVYVSTVGVFGNTHGGVVDEGYRRDLRDGFLSWYDETKYGAHEVAQQRAAAGTPVVIVLPSQVYGPGDHSAIGDQIRRAHAGRLRALALDDVGLGFVEVHDLAAGIVAGLDRGSLGEAYVLSGPRARLREVLHVAASLGGHSLPGMRVPTGLIRALVPLGGAIGRPGVAEVVASAAGVTYWATSAKAQAELGFDPRSIEDGLRALLGAAEPDRA